MTTYKYQEQFALELAESVMNGNREYVRTTIRNLKNKAQAAYIAAKVVFILAHDMQVIGTAESFANFMHPNNR